MFATNAENKLSTEYLDKGYIIRPVGDVEALEWIRNQFSRIVREALPDTDNLSIEDAIPNNLLNRKTLKNFSSFVIYILSLKFHQKLRIQEFT